MTAVVAAEPDLVQRVRSRLAETGAEASPARVAAALRAEGGVLGDSEVLQVVSALRADLAGAGPLEPLLRDPGITDVLVNHPQEVWVDGDTGLRQTDVAFPDEAAIRRLAQRLAGSAGRRLDDASPYVDARLRDGTRLHAVVPPVAPDGTCLSLRLPRRRAFTLEELVTAGSIPRHGGALLRSFVTGRLAFLVTGGTGTGKTSLLAALLSMVDPGERLLLVEDSAELNPRHPHVVRLESRPPNVEGKGGVDLHQLVRQALRMRPDRLVVGEVRGGEVVDLLAALNTGHDGGCGTLHANTAADVPARLEALAVAAGLSREALHSQLAAAVHGVVHLVREGPRRRVAEVCVLRRGADGFVAAVPAVTVDRDGSLRRGEGMSTLQGILAARGVSW